MSTRAVMASLALMSEKSSAERSSSLRSSSSTSSSSAVSMIDCSSCEAASSGSPSPVSPCRGRVMRCTSPTTSQMTGYRMTDSARMTYALRRAMPLAFCLATIFGIVSPKMMTSSVSTTVDTHVHCSPTSRMTITEPSDDAAMLTRLLPMRMALRVRSKWSRMPTAVFARRLPSSAAFSSRRRLADEYDISDAEKNADSAMSTTSATKYHTMLMPSRPPSPGPLRRPRPCRAPPAAGAR